MTDDAQTKKKQKRFSPVHIAEGVVVLLIVGAIG